VSDYPYLFIWNIYLPAENYYETFNSAVCVRECPYYKPLTDTTYEYIIDWYPTNYTKEYIASNPDTINENNKIPYMYASEEYIDAYCLPIYDELPPDIQTAY
jgi:hypothetical protein